MTWHGGWAGDCAADHEKGRAGDQGDGNSREAATRRVFCDETGALTVDARGLTYRELNYVLRAHVRDGTRAIAIRNVVGQRYIGTNLRCPVRVEIHGTPGGDLGAFMDGPRLTVFGNAQDCVGNTMTSGEIVVHGRAGDVVAMSMRGGAIFIRDDVGSRCAIHMKEYDDRCPLVVIGGTAHDFLGEYMAGGTLVVLGLGLAPGERHQASFIGTGMHGGRIFMRGSVAPHQLGEQVEIANPDDGDTATIVAAVKRFCALFGGRPDEILGSRFVKILPKSHRPYGGLYGARESEG